MAAVEKLNSCCFYPGLPKQQISLGLHRVLKGAKPFKNTVMTHLVHEEAD